eukprot:SAG11_NODE_1276_length_5324_cov_2.528421_5_plen_83_part_00
MQREGNFASPKICVRFYLSGRARPLSWQDAYLTLVGRIRESLGEDVAISSDFISGFCGALLSALPPLHCQVLLARLTGVSRD